jgi:hypothetical protein
MPPLVVRYDRRRFWRALAVVWLVGTAAAALLASGAGARRSLLARLWEAVHLDPAVGTFLLYEGLTLAVVLYGAGHVLRRRDELRLEPGGLSVRESLGTYRVAWDNIEAADEYLGSMAGLRLRDPGALLATHAGSEEQRALLAAREPFGPYHLVFTREQLDCGLERFLTEVERCRRDPAARAALAADGAPSPADAGEPPAARGASPPR